MKNNEIICPVCGMIKTRLPDQCDYCYSAKVAYDSIMQYISAHLSGGQVLRFTDMISAVSGLSADRTKIATASLGSGQKSPLFVHAPAGLRGRYTFPGGAIRRTLVIINAGMRFGLVPHSEWVMASILDNVYHALGRYVWAGPDSKFHFRQAKNCSELSKSGETARFISGFQIEITSEVANVLFSNPYTIPLSNFHAAYQSVALQADYVTPIDTE